MDMEQIFEKFASKKIEEMSNQARWSVLQSYNLLKLHKNACYLSFGKWKQFEHCDQKNRTKPNVYPAKHMEPTPDILKGKAALLTGGGSGIGYEIAAQFGKHGAAISIMGRRKNVIDSAVASLLSLGVQAVGFQGDVRKQEDAKKVVELTVKHFGTLDILVNAAAGNFLVSPEDLSPNGFRTVIDIDAVGTFIMCHEVVKYLKKGAPGRTSDGGGLILNISATLHYTATWYQIHVAAAKAAVDALTRNLALEWGTDYDIRVNGIAPGLIGDTTGLSKVAPEEIDSKMKEYLPLYKLGDKWDIAMSALYLSSNAGKFVNGATLVVDGGLWFCPPRYLSKNAVKELSRAVETRSRTKPVGLATTSKL